MLGNWEGNRRPSRKQWQPTIGFMALITCGLTAEDQDKLRNPMLILNMGLHFCVFIYVLFLVFSRYAVTSSTVMSDADSSLIHQGKHHLYSTVYCCVLLCNFHLDVDLYRF